MRARLTLLGGLKLEREGEALVGKAAQRRRLGVLALLAASPDGSATRERILSLIWPDQGPESARRLLTEAVYVLRKELGERSIQSRGDTLTLDFDVVSCDLVDVRQAVTRGDWSAAAALLAGPFLDTWFLPENPEFERWAERERALVSAEQRRVFERLVDTCELAGDLEGAAEWCRHLTDLDPHSSAAALRRADFLARSGEPAAALRTLRDHEQRLREDLEVEPPADVVRRIESLRPGNVAGTATPSPRARIKESAAASPRRADAREQPQPAPVVPPAPPRRPWRLILAATLTLVLAIAGWRQLRQDSAPPSARRHRVAVLYFDDHSAEQDLGHLADGLTEEVINQLSGATAFDVVGRNAVKQFRGRALSLDSIAAAVNASIVVEGSVQMSGTMLRATVQLLDAPTGSRLGGAEVERPTSELFALERGVGRQIAEALRRQVGADVTLRAIREGTRSTLARSLMLRAQREFDFAMEFANRSQDADVASAVGALERADTLLNAASSADGEWAAPLALRVRLATELVTLTRGPERHAALDRARALVLALLAQAPNEPQAMELDGLVAYMTLSERDSVGADTASARALLAHAERRLRDAVGLDPTIASAWATLSHVLWRKGAFAEADATARRALQEDAYLVHARDVYEQAFFASLATRDMAKAAEWCERGGVAFPADVAMVQCELTLMSRRRDDVPPDTARAWALVRKLDAMESPAKAAAMGRNYSPVYRRMVAAIVTALAGDTARARRVLHSARADVREHRVRSIDLGFDEAHLLLALADTSAALARLDALIAERPAMASYLRNDPVFAAIAPLLRREEGKPVAQ